MGSVDKPMMPKRRKRTDTSRESKLHRASIDYQIYQQPKRRSMTKEEFRERLMEDLNVSAI